MKTTSTIRSEISMQYSTFLGAGMLRWGYYTSHAPTFCLDKREQALSTFEWTLKRHMQCSPRNASSVWKTDSAKTSAAFETLESRGMKSTRPLSSATYLLISSTLAFTGCITCSTAEDVSQRETRAAPSSTRSSFTGLSL